MSMSRLDKLPKWARDHIIEQNCRIDELTAALKSMLNAYQPCSKPIGAPGSDARLQWEDECAVRDAARKVIAKAEGRE